MTRTLIAFAALASPAAAHSTGAAHHHSETLLALGFGVIIAAAVIGYLRATRH